MQFKLHELDTMLCDGMFVYEHYYPIATGRNLSKLKVKMLSPFREEKDPSFSIFQHRTKTNIFFKDHGVDKIGSHWQFVMDLYGIDFKEAVKKVKFDILGIQDDEFNPKLLSVIKRAYNNVSQSHKSTAVEIFINPRDWSQSDVDYYGSAGISPYILSLFHASALSSFDMKKENKTIRINGSDDDPIYSYTIGKAGRQKICRPMSKDSKYKWTSNLIAEEDVFGLDMVPKSCEHLFLIGGNRDTMSFFENMKMPAIALASESSTLTESLYSFLRHVAKNIWVLYDNDKQGYRKAEQFHEQFGLPSLNHLYEKFSSNDFVDVYQKGANTLKCFETSLAYEINKLHVR